jgi:hypothetical protein
MFAVKSPKSVRNVTPSTNPAIAPSKKTSDD